MSILRIRRSQLVSKHGVGSVFPGTDGISRLTAGLDRWFSHEYEENNKNVHKDDFKIIFEFLIFFKIFIHTSRTSSLTFIKLFREPKVIWPFFFIGNSLKYLFILKPQCEFQILGNL